jgi:hypothetical protein
MKKLLLLLLLLSFNLFFTSQVQSKNLSDAFTDSGSMGEIADKAGYDKKNIDMNSFLKNSISFVLSFLGVVFLILVIYGGITWMTSLGNEQKVTSAKNLLIAAIIGLIIVLLAYAISLAVMENIGSKTLKGFQSTEETTVE